RSAAPPHLGTGPVATTKPDEGRRSAPSESMRGLPDRPPYGRPLAGEKLAMVAALITVKTVALVPVPSVVITLSLPVVAFGGMVAVTDVGVAAVTGNVSVPSLTVGIAVPTWRLNPLIVTLSPTRP